MSIMTKEQRAAVELSELAQFVGSDAYAVRFDAYDKKHNPRPSKAELRDQEVRQERLRRQREEAEVAALPQREAQQAQLMAQRREDWGRWYDSLDERIIGHIDHALWGDHASDNPDSHRHAGR
jgi:hypothetical protein